MKLIDLAGQRFGELVVLEKTGRYQGSTGWKCECDCGKTTIKSSRYLRDRPGAHSNAACDTCADELRAGKRIFKNDIIQARQRDYFEDRGTLYTGEYTIAMMEDVWAALEKEFGPVVDEPALPLTFTYYPSTADRTYALRKQREREAQDEWSDDAIDAKRYREKARSEIAFLQRERIEKQVMQRADTLLAKERNVRTREAVMRKAKEFGALLERTP